MSGLARIFPLEEYIHKGHTACPGCPIPISLRIMLKALGPKTVLVVPACCTSVIQGIYPHYTFGVPLVNVVFAAAAAVASGIRNALDIKGVKDANVVVWAGDGGTVDIGLQALSGAAERNEDIIYVCYDNEAYMNTGIQRSGSTPYGAWTTTTPTGKKENKKMMPFIVAAHNVPYVATASPADPIDMFNKFKKAKNIRGFRYIHIHSPCVPGWRIDSSKTIEVARLAIETGMWVLFEIEHGKFRVTGRSLALLKNPELRKPVEEYIKMQGRFAKMTKEDIEKLQKWVDEVWEHIRMLAKESGQI